MKCRTFFSISIIICTLVIVPFLIVDCSRDNPFDLNSPDYQPGKKTHVNFVDSVITGYLFDSVKIQISWSDTARGGQLYLNKFTYWCLTDPDGCIFMDTIHYASRNL